MTDKKAIRRLEELCLHEQDICDCKNDVDCADCYIKMAIKSLEKQIPKKPIGDDTVKICSCSKIVFLDGHIKRCNFCSKCGQAIDWSEDEE